MEEVRSEMHKLLEEAVTFYGSRGHHEEEVIS